MVIRVVYENGVFRPIEPLELPENSKVDITIAPAPGANKNEESSAPLAGLAALAGTHPENPELPVDLAEQHDHYLYGKPEQP